MPTPEEEIANLNKQIEEFKAKGVAADGLNLKVKSLEEQLSTMAESTKAEKLELAKAQALLEFPASAGMKDLIKGATPEEIKANAKALHDTLTARDAEFIKKHNIKADANLQDWSGVPGSVPAEFAIASDRDAQYAEVRKSQIPMRIKLQRLMGMHFEDLHKRTVIGARRALGIR